MGAGQSTRNMPDYVYVNFYIDEKEHIFVKLFVFNTENRYQLRKFMNNNQDIEFSYGVNSNCYLLNPINSRELHPNINKSLEEFIEERNLLHPIL